MPAYFESGFMVREPAWHGLGTVLDEYPGREEAMRLAGHNFSVEERPLLMPVSVIDHDAEGQPIFDLTGPTIHVPKHKAIVKVMPGHETDGKFMAVAGDTYGIVQNDVAWDIADAIAASPEVRYETAGVLKNGAICWVLVWLDEPTLIPGDDSPILPYGNIAWSHDGSTAVSCRSTSIRVVCANTQSAAEAEGRRLGTDFTFKHSRKVMDRIADAKMAIRGIRAGHEEYIEIATELAKQPVTESQRELFIAEMIPMPPTALISERVERNVDEARASVRNLFNDDSLTVPEAHRLTAYGLHLAGTEYLDHLRGYRSTDSYFGRTILKHQPAKAKLHSLINEVVAA